MLLVELPTYMKHILRFNIGQVRYNAKCISLDVYTIHSQAEKYFFLNDDAKERAAFGSSLSLHVDF